jgi:hypothetical protein
MEKTPTFPAWTGELKPQPRECDEHRVPLRYGDGIITWGTPRKPAK